MSKIDQYRMPLQCRLRQIVRNVPSIIVGKRRGAFGNYERPEPPE